jgi:hypothetical protein
MTTQYNLINNDAKQIVDLLFDTDCFKKEITRDNLNAIEEFISHILKTRVDSQVRKNKLVNSLSDYSNNITQETL